MIRALLLVKMVLSVRVRRNGETHKIAIEQEVEMQEHVNCENTEIVNDSMSCEMDNYHEVCSDHNACLEQSGGVSAAWKCDCSVVFGPIQFFDAGKCAWKEMSKSCPITTTTTLPETTEAEVTTSVSTTSTWTTTTWRRRRRQRHRKKGTKRKVRSCTPLTTPWSCSFGDKHGSVCSSSCPGRPSKLETRKCICTGQQCQWNVKGRACSSKRQKQQKQDRPGIMNRSGGGSSSNSLLDGFNGLGAMGETLQRLFAQIANFNLDSSTMNFHW